MGKPRTVCQDANFCVATWNNVAIVDVWGDMDVPRMRKLSELYATLLEEFPNGICAMSCIRKSTPVSTAEARTESTRFLKEFGERILHHAMVIEADGVLGLMLRSVVRGLNALLRGNRMSLHDSVEHAVPAIAPYVATDLPRVAVIRELTGTIASIRAAWKPPRTVHVGM